MKKLITIILCLFTCVITVKADQNFSNVKVSVAGLTEESYKDVYIKVSDVTLSDNNTYYAVFTKDNNASDSFTTSSYPEYYGKLAKVNNELKVTSGYIDAAEKYGNVYVTFYSGSSSTYEKVGNSVLIKRTDELKLSKRFTVNLSSSSTKIVLNSINNTSNVKKANYKLGEVKDYAILRKIKNSDNTGLEELLTYGKKGTNLISSASVKLNSSDTINSLYEQSKVSAGKYYYLYTELDTEDGKYYAIEDINLYYAKTVSSKIELYDYTKSEFVWDLSLPDWNKFVELFKANENLTNYKKNIESDDATITVTSDDTSLKITQTEENKTMTVTFSRADNIVSYEANETINVNEILFEEIMTSIALDTLCDKFGYNYKEVLNLLESKIKYTSNDNGIEFTFADVNVSDSDSSVEYNISLEGFKTLKFDIVNGLKGINTSTSNNTTTVTSETTVKEEKQVSSLKHKSNNWNLYMEECYE